MGCHRLLPGFPNSCSLYSLFSRQQPGLSFKNKSDHRHVTHLQTPRCASRGLCLPSLFMYPFFCLYYSVPITLASFLFLKHITLVFTPRAFALLITTPWCAIFSNVRVTTFLSFRFQLKCHFYKWSLFLKSFLLCQYISFASLCLNFFIALITFQMISFICMFSCLWPDSLIRI